MAKIPVQPTRYSLRSGEIRLDGQTWREQFDTGTFDVVDGHLAIVSEKLGTLGSLRNLLIRRRRTDRQAQSLTVGHERIGALRQRNRALHRFVEQLQLCGQRWAALGRQVGGQVIEQGPEAPNYLVLAGPERPNPGLLIR